MALSYTSDQGDSGAGLFNDQGEFAGVNWGGNQDRWGNPLPGAMAVSTAKLHKFPSFSRSSDGTISLSLPRTRLRNRSHPPQSSQLQQWQERQALQALQGHKGQRARTLLRWI